MGYKIKIDEQEYEIKDGFTIIDDFNETLDSATVQFVTYGCELDKEPFDRAELFHTDANKMTKRYFDVDNITDDVYCYGSTFDEDDHFYTVSLFSETKGLERITLPSMSITQPTRGFQYIRYVRTFVQNLLNQYAPRIKVCDTVSDTFFYRPSYKLSQQVIDRFSNVKCPEFQWTNPTLREVITDLFSTQDCIPIVKRNVIYYIDLNSRGNPIDKTKLSRITKNFSSNDYVSELTMYMKNGIGKIATESCRYKSVTTTSESGEITTDNCAIITQKPIYTIKKLKLYFLNAEQISGGTLRYQIETHGCDVSEWVKEYEDWRTLFGGDVSIFGERVSSFTDSQGYSGFLHKSRFLYYKRGGTSIENLGKVYTYGAIKNSFYSDTFIEKCKYLGMDAHTSVVYGIDNPQPRKVFYEIEYETLYDTAMHFGKYLPNKHPENRVFDNQENAMVDVQNQSIFEYAKVNRLSNQIIEIYGEYESESEIPQLSDCLGDAILFHREISYGDNKLCFKGYLTKNYILKDYFTGVMSKKRSWQIASQQEALTRHDIVKFYVEASFSQKTDRFNDSNLKMLTLNSTGHNGLIEDLARITSMSQDIVESDKKMDKVILQTYEGNSYFPDVGKGLVMDASCEVLGYSLCWTFGFNDNYKSADYALKDGNKYQQDFYVYANTHGSFSTLKAMIVYDYPDEFVDKDGNPFVLPASMEEGGTPYDCGNNSSNYATNTVVAMENTTRQKPLVSYSGLGSNKFGFELRLPHIKDMREITRLSVQFEYCSDTEDIIITPEFIKCVRAVAGNLSDDLALFMSDAETYDMGSKTAKGIQYHISYFHVSHYVNDNQTLICWQTALETGQFKSWCIARIDTREILLAVNTTQRRNIYFNLLNSRDTNVYYSIEDRHVLGNITPASINHLQDNRQEYEASLNENE